MREKERRGNEREWRMKAEKKGEAYWGRGRRRGSKKEREWRMKDGKGKSVHCITTSSSPPTSSSLPIFFFTVLILTFDFLSLMLYPILHLPFLSSSLHLCFPSFVILPSSSFPPLSPPPHDLPSNNPLRSPLLSTSISLPSSSIHLVSPCLLPFFPSYHIYPFFHSPFTPTTPFPTLLSPLPSSTVPLLYFPFCSFHSFLA